MSDVLTPNNNHENTGVGEINPTTTTTTTTMTSPTESSSVAVPQPQKRKESFNAQLAQKRFEMHELEQFNEKVNAERRDIDMIYDIATNPDGIRLTAVTNEIIAPLLVSQFLRYLELINGGTVPLSELPGLNDSSIREGMNFIEALISAKANDDRSRVVKLAFFLLTLVLDIGVVKRLAAIPEPQHPFPDEMYAATSATAKGTFSTSSSSSSTRAVDLPSVVPSTLIIFLNQWLYPKLTALSRGQLKSTSLDDFVKEAITQYVIRFPPMFVGLIDVRRASLSPIPPSDEDRRRRHQHQQQQQHETPTK